MSTLLNFSEIPQRDNYSLLDHYRFSSDIFVGSYYRVTKVRYLPTDEKRIFLTYQKLRMSPDYLQKFITELSALLRLDHTNFCKVHDYFQDVDTFYIVCERAIGGRLISRLRASSQMLDERMCANYMQQVFSMLKHLQGQNIVYRNLKPENLYFASRDSQLLKLVSFDACNILEPGQMIAERVGSPKYVAPEVLRGSYDYSCDMWSAGILMHLLIVGNVPFNAKTEQELFRVITAGRINFSGPAWERVSDPAKDLLRRILVTEPRSRISLDEALDHPWLRILSDSPPLRDKSAEYFQNLSQFQVKERSRKALYRYIAAHFSMDREEMQLTKLFRYLDVNNDGLLSRQEIKQGALKLFGNKVRNIEAEIDKMIAESDLDGSGEISYSEFVVAAIGRRKVLERRRLEEVFESIDVDSNGFIDKKELKTMLKRFITDERIIDEIISIADRNRDSLIDLNEFINAMTKA